MDGDRNKFLLVEIESIGVFKKQEDCQKWAPKIFEFLVKETAFKEEEISAKFRDLEAFHVAAKAKTMDQLLK